MSKPSATASMSGQQYGDWFEGQVQKGLDELMQEGPSFFARLYDTRSANSFLPKQAGDFIGCNRGRGFLLEAKASVQFESLMENGAMRKLIKDHQALGSYLFGRAEGAGLIVFRSRASHLMELWDGARLREVYVTPRARLGPSQGLIASTNCSDDNVIADFKTLFERAFQ